MKLENRIFEGVEYTLVDKYDIEEMTTIYHFAGDDSDLFCKKNNNEYIPITDEKIIDYIKNTYHLKSPEIYFSVRLPVQILRLVGIKKIQEIPEEQRNKIINEQITELCKLESGVDRGTLEKRLNSVKLYTGEFNRFMAGFYHPVSNSIVYNEMLPDDEVQRGQLHEVIHASSGVMFNLNIRNEGLIEGATENMVEKLYGEKTSTYYITKVDFSGDTTNDDIKFNFSRDTVYVPNVSLIRQMEYAMDFVADKDVLEGSNKFFQKFADKYGKDAYRFICHRTNRLLHPETIKDEKEYFKETQNTILEVIFNKEFAEIKSLAEAKSYLKRLQDFELVRGKVEGDTTFKDFYEEKLQMIKEKFIERGFGKNYVEHILAENQYKEKQFYPEETEEQKYERRQNEIAREIAGEIKDNENIEEKIKEFQSFIIEKGDEEYLLLTQNGKPKWMQVGNARQSTWFWDIFGDLDEKVQQEGVNFILNDSNNERLKFEEENLIQNNQLLKEEVENLVNARKAYEEKEELNKIASSQRLSSVNKIIRLIREKTCGKDKENNKEMDIEGEFNG